MSRQVIVIILSTVLAPLAGVSRAEEPQTVAISWNTLAADGELFSDPFAKMSPAQLQDLAYFDRVDRLISADKLAPDGSDATKAARIVRDFEQQGIDVFWLLSQREQIRDLRDTSLRRHAASVARKHDGHQIRLTGYAIPLKVDREQLTEFFLVPSISFCSHASPPPSNQTVHVRLPEGVSLPGRTTVLQVTGKLQQRQTRIATFGPHLEAEYAIELTEIKVVDSRVIDESRR